MSLPMNSHTARWCVLTWNIHGAEQPDLQVIASSLRAAEPDVVCLQEVRHAQAEAIAGALSMRFAWALKHHPWRPLFPSTAEGLALLTPHRLDLPGHTELSRNESKRSWKRRIAQWALVSRDDATAYRAYNTHLSPHGLADRRRDEATRLTAIVAEHGEDPPAIVAGDFNDDTDPTVIYALPGIEHLRPPPTLPAEAPTRTLDHVLLPPDAVDVSVEVPGGGPDWARLSDHLPVITRFGYEWVAGDWADGSA